jgi:general secretion pathway protein I
VRGRRQRGFTLLEVVVAFVVLALVLASVFEVFSTWLARTGELGDHSQALMIAQSHLASVGVEEPVKEGDTGGESDDRRYRWSLRIARHEERNEAGAVAQATYSLYRAEVRVAWQGGDGRDHEIAMANLQMGPRI